MSVRTVGPGQTFSTIQAALDNLYATVGAVAFTETHTIEIYTATYTETAISNTGLNPTATYRLVITSATGNSPVIDGQSTRSSAIIISAIPYVTVKGITACNCLSGAIYFATSSDYGNINNNICYSNNRGIRIVSSSSLNIYNNICYSNADSGIYSELSSGNECYNNYCYSNTNYGIRFYGSILGNFGGIIYNNLCRSNGIGIDFYTHTDGFIFNNTLYLNSLSGIALESTSTTATLRNNVIWSSAGRCINVANTSQAGFSSNYNDIYSTGTAVAGYWTADRETLSAWQIATGGDANSISLNPLLVNAGGTVDLDYKITTGSPCKNAGDSLVTVFTTDYFGTTRPQGTAWDIGFHEFIISTTSKKTFGFFRGCVGTYSAVGGNIKVL
jgi:parallel beta-helix repeat protein